MGFFGNLVSWLRVDLGIDLGTANTLVYAKNKGIVLREPSVVAIEKNSRKILAIGNEAKSMLGRTPGNIIAIRPMRDGVISDFEVTEYLIRSFIKMVKKKRSILKPYIIIGIPSGITHVERRAVKDAAMQAGAKHTILIEEPLAAAIGAQIPINEPKGTMIVDIGGGTTEVAVLSMGEIVTSQSIRVAGDEMDAAIVEHCRKNYNLLIGERSAEQIKIQIGSAYPIQGELDDVEIKGRDLVTGLPRTFSLTAAEIRHALMEPVNTIVQIVKMVLENTPPELVGDIMIDGIYLAGGGALLRGLDEYISEETSIKVQLIDDPLSCVALGAGKVLEECYFHKDTYVNAYVSERR